MRRWRRVRIGTAALLAGAALVALAACGARTDLGDERRTRSGAGGDGEGGDGDGGQASCPGATCSDITRGTLLLEDADGNDLGLLFLFDATGSCNGAPTHYQLIVSLPGGSECRRNSDMVVSEANPDLLVAAADNHGGSLQDECGGDPFDEAMTLELVRDSCAADRYALRVTNSKPGSPFNFEASAQRCRCDIGWAPCEQPLPDDICAP